LFPTKTAGTCFFFKKKKDIIMRCKYNWDTRVTKMSFFFYIDTQGTNVRQPIERKTIKGVGVINGIDNTNDMCFAYFW
jgi:hypothetical protein